MRIADAGSTLQRSLEGQAEWIILFVFLVNFESYEPILICLLGKGFIRVAQLQRRGDSDCAEVSAT